MSVQFKMDMDEAEITEEVSDDTGKDATPSPKMKVDSSLDISEIQMNFDLEENEMKIEREKRQIEEAEKRISQYTNFMTMLTVLEGHQVAVETEV